ncbi:caspase family protein [Bradyrhizobium jicamae]|uniref:Caspase family protein n=1 Tax=Bradyrhizobium jicamae TaxID=280332 RepID=A0ABS5FYC2_9BRAD|nr:caspase family protein [Bradyrhizobium jicamae]MBR0801797.1 caspase family protein [Bradyrhizobium jicamae]
MRSVSLILLGFFLITVNGEARADKRVALIVGMSRYQHVPHLANPARDAEAVSALFKRVGFDVVDTEYDLGIADFRRAIRNFSKATQESDVAVVYFAGHGIEVDGTNYLIPTDAKLLSDFDVEDETVSVDRLLKAMDAAKRLKLVILDACRHNPFDKSMSRTGVSRAIGRGLTRIEPTTSDTLIAFAAKAGALAADGDGENSPFAAALVKYIAEPGLDLRIAFGRVRDEVLEKTGNRQEPFVYGSLGGNAVALVPKSADPEAAARVDYELAAQVGSIEVWQSFLRVHGIGLYADLARAQSNKLKEAQLAREKTDAARRAAEAQAAQKAEDLRKQLEEQSARQTAETRRKLSEEAKKELDEARQALAERTKKELAEAKEQLERAQQQAEEARKQQDDVRRQAIADAQLEVGRVKREAIQQSEKMSSLTESKTTPSIDASDISRLLQAHLKRVGCDPGNGEGSWDEPSKRALALFNKNAQTSFDVKVASLDALEAVRSKRDRVCPLICSKGQRVDGDRCVQIACNRGYFLNSSGECEKRPESPPKSRELVHRESPLVRPRAPARSNGKCFSFAGKAYCE